MIEPTQKDISDLALRCARFVDAALSALWDGHDFDDGDIQAEAERQRLIVCVPFDPEVHDDEQGYGVKAGEDWYVAAPDLQALLSTGAAPFLTQDDDDLEGNTRCSTAEPASADRSKRGRQGGR